MSANILHSFQELQKAREIFYRLDTRQLYKWVEFKVYPWAVRNICRQRITPRAIVAAAKRAISPHSEAYGLVQELGEEHIIVDLAEMHYGMKEHNPLRYVKFYSKRKPNREYSFVN
jgi:deoxynucleoside triphosphate triphosphohydrolase SAMHD1